MAKFILFFILIFLVIAGGSLSVFFLNRPDVTSQIEAVVEETEVTIIEEDREVRVPILIYHHIRQLKAEDATSSHQFILFPENFENQLKYLQKNNFTSISFKNLSDYFFGTFEIPEKPIIITFDDGIISQYNNAFPVLKKYNFTATFFIFPNPIGRSVNYMSWEQLIEMDQAGMEIGSHGWYHLYWDRISVLELDKEIVQSKQKIEEKLGHEISAIAYPFGSYNDEVVEFIKNSDYKIARDIINGVNHTQDDLYNLRGYFVTNNFPMFISIISR